MPKAGFDRKERAAFFVEHESHEIIGFLINGLARFRDWGCVEFALAITNEAYRRRGYGWQTLGLGMEYWFERGATICWCYYSLLNPGSVGMAQRIKSPDMPNGPTRMGSGASSSPAAAGAFTRTQWQEVKRRIGWS